MSLVNHVHLWANSAPTNPSEAGAEHLAAREEVERHCARLFTSTGPVTPLIGEHHVTFVIPAGVGESLICCISSLSSCVSFDREQHTAQ
jgi:hypothetical protein